MKSNNQLEQCKNSLLEIGSSLDVLQKFIPEIDSVPTPSHSILFAGKFGVGKTRIINSLLEKNLLPTMTMPMRRFYLRIRFSKGNNTIIIHKDQQSEQIKDSSLLQKITERDNDNSITSIEMQGEFSILKQGVDILETPGLGEVNPEHEKITNTLLNQCRILILVLDTNTPFLSAELEFIQKIPEHIKHAVVVINDFQENEDTIILPETISSIIWEVEKNISTVEHTYVSTLENYPLEFREKINNPIIWGIRNLSKKIEVLSSDIDLSEYAQKLSNTAEQMLRNIQSAPTFESEETSDLQSRSDQLDKAKQLWRIISDQQQDIYSTLIESFEAEVFIFNDNRPERSRVENIFIRHTENLDYELNNHLLHWASSQELLLEEQLQRLYDKIIREITRTTRKEFPNRKITLGEIAEAISKMKHQTNENQFKNLLLRELMGIVETKANFLNDLVRQNLVRNSEKGVSEIDDQALKIINLESKLEKIYRQLNRMLS